MATLKYSRQREAIKTFLMNRSDHPTADVVYTNLRKEYPNISLGTVYRNLSLLEELGELKRFSVGDGLEHYDANLTPHQHFICTRCHQVHDVWTHDTDSIVAAAADLCPGKIEACQITFLGLCDKCRSQS